MFRLAILCLIVSAGDLTPHHLLKDINWQTQQIGQNLTIRSYNALSPHKIRAIQEATQTIERKFEQYYGVRCSLRLVEVRIIRSSWLNSSEYFDNIDPKYIVFGRYFGLSEVIYLTPELSALDHELVHYMFHECNMSFDTDDQEHQKLDEFMLWRAGNE
jgi:hypothetical protein